MKRILILLLCTVITGCTGLRKQSAYTLGMYNLGYAIDANDAIGVISAFDNGKETYIHLRPESVRSFSVLDVSDVDATRVSFRRDGNYVIVPGVFKKLLLLRGKNRCTVHNMSEFSTIPSSVGGGTSV